MGSKALLATTLFISAQTLCGIAASHAADLLWEVENPYRFFKRKHLVRCAGESVQRRARRARPALADQHHVEGRAAPQRSRLQGSNDADLVSRDPTPRLCAEPARLGVADRRSQLL